MIQLVSGIKFLQGTSPDTFFSDGKKLTVRVLDSRGSRAEINVAGKIFTVLTKTPLEKGAKLFVQVIRTETEIELKVLSRVLTQTNISSSQLNELLGNDPVLIRALMRTGISLKNINLNKLRRILDEKGKKDDPEFARLISVMEEKGLAGMLDGESILQEKYENENHERRETDNWKDLFFQTASVRDALIRQSDTPGDLSIFNHIRSANAYNWMILPVRIIFDEVIYSGSLRICIELSEKTVSQGILVLKSENRTISEEWCFGITDLGEKKMYLLKGPEIEAEKLDNFREKVRKQGFVFVDTKNRGIADGFSPEIGEMLSGIDTEV